MKIKTWTVSWKPRIEGEATEDNTVNLGSHLAEFYPTRADARNAYSQIKAFMIYDQFGSVNPTLKITCQYLEV
jgi:hypothetical protein